MNDTKTIKGTECIHCSCYAEMEVYPSPFAGLWQCTNEDCSASEYCEHENRHVESDEDNYGHTQTFYVCDDCEQTIPYNIADPALDAAEALADSGREDY